MYQNFFFDLYGTLLDAWTDEKCNATWEKFAAWMAEHGMVSTPRSLRMRYQAAVRKLEKAPTPYAYGEIDVAPVFATLCRRLRPDASDDLCWQAGEAFRRCSRAMLALYPNTISTLQALRDAGKKVYLVSNAQRIFTWQELQETGLLPCFDDVLISSDVGCRKPDPVFFRLMLACHGLDASQTVMVGNDSQSDMGGAAAAGLDGVYLRTDISPRNDPIPDSRFVFLDGDIGHVKELIR